MREHLFTLNKFHIKIYVSGKREWESYTENT